eukprot:c4959_g1_i1.p1 GENE.c4959_g1_i1~~c4959_g1_i1.p1  ORF type:complete len:164 (+),score=34.54 c4959_g1_i1:493-984(+)
MKQVMYITTLEELVLASQPQGARVRAVTTTPEDIQILSSMSHQFFVEVGLRFQTLPLSYYQKAAEEERAHFVVDENQTPVCLVMTRGVTDECVRISAVFTPSEHRKHGYASYLVGHITHMWLTQRGKKSVYLFADVNYPASNSVYQSLGFKFATYFQVMLPQE